jgi:hypothetical protein
MKGGGINYLPLPRDVTTPAEFTSKFDLISMTAHGSQDGQVFLVPENTWILFRGPSSASIPRLKEQDKLLATFRFLQPGETQEQYHERIFNAIQNRSLFSEFLFSPEDPFQPGRMSIYEPGDLIQNVLFQIDNFHYPYGLMGVWKLPLPHNILTKLNSTNLGYELIIKQYEAILKKHPEIIAKKIKVDEALIERNYGPIINEKMKGIETELMQDPHNSMFKMQLNNPSSIHEVLQNRGKGSTFNPPQFTKPYTFIVIESCRASEDMPPHLHIMPENVEAVEADPSRFGTHLQTMYPKQTTETNANYARFSQGFAEGIKRSRRLSLGVRRIPETCYKSLFVLSRQNIMRLQQNPALPPAEKSMLGALLAGHLVPKGHMIEILNAPRNMNTRLLNLPPAERFFVGEGVEIGGNYAVVIDIEIQRGAGNTSQVIYRVRFADGHVETKSAGDLGRMNQEDFAGIRMSLTNAEQTALTAPANASPNMGVPASAPAVPSQILLFAEYGSPFYVKSNLADKVDAIKAEMGKYPFKAFDRVQIKTTPPGPLAGKMAEILAEIQYVEKRKGFAYTIRLIDSDEVRAINPALIEKAKSGGGGKTRRKGKMAKKFCRCVKQVRKTVRARAKESAAIGICTKSVLQRKGRTLKRFKCTPRPSLQTQKLK